MNVLQIEPGFLKRNYKSILKSFLSNMDILFLMVILVCACSYALSTISNLFSDYIYAAPIVGVLMLLQGVPAVFLIYCAMFLCARRDGQLKSSTMSIVITSFMDTFETFKEHKRGLMFNVIVFTIVYGILVYIRTSTPPDPEEVKNTVESGILHEFNKIFGEFFISVYLFGIWIRSEYSLMSFYMFNSLTKRYFNATEDASCVALKNAETLNLKHSILGLLINQLLPLMGILTFGTFLIVPYLLALIFMYHAWLEMFVGPGKTAESKEKEEIMEGELKPIPIKN